jgi:hypothetical protein
MNFTVPLFGILKKYNINEGAETLPPPIFDI